MPTFSKSCDGPLHWPSAVAAHASGSPGRWLADAQHRIERTTSDPGRSRLRERAHRLAARAAQIESLGAPSSVTRPSPSGPGGKQPRNRPVGQALAGAALAHGPAPRRRECRRRRRAPTAATPATHAEMLDLEAGYQRHETSPRREPVAINGRKKLRRMIANPWNMTVHGAVQHDCASRDHQSPFGRRAVARRARRSSMSRQAAGRARIAHAEHEAGATTLGRTWRSMVRRMPRNPSSRHPEYFAPRRIAIVSPRTHTGVDDPAHDRDAI